MLRAKSSRRNFVCKRSSVLHIVFEFVTDRTSSEFSFRLSALNHSAKNIRTSELNAIKSKKQGLSFASGPAGIETCSFIFRFSCASRKPIRQNNAIIAARQLRSYLEEFSIIPKEQFAYRQHHSTEDALVYAINNFLMAKDQGLYTGLVFVDMSKAFDRVEHQTLINDLSNIGVRGSALKWFINYLTDRQQQIRCGNTVSAPTSCSRGVPQGSVLGPLLFLLYTRKVPEVLSATKTITSVLFADDILIYCSGKKPTTLAACLSEAATRLGTWLTERGLCINVNKTKAMLLPPKHQQCPADISIRCCDATLSIVNEYKYLGVIIDSTLSWEAHVDSVVSKVAKKIGALRRAGNSLTQAARRQYYFVCHPVRPAVRYECVLDYTHKRTPEQTHSIK